MLFLSDSVTLQIFTAFFFHCSYIFFYLNMFALQVLSVLIWVKWFYRTHLVVFFFPDSFILTYSEFCMRKQVEFNP